MGKKLDTEGVFTLGSKTKENSKSSDAIGQELRFGPKKMTVYPAWKMTTSCDKIERILCQSISLTWRSNFESGEGESTWSACCSFPSLHRYHDLGLWRLSFSLLESCARAKYTDTAPRSYKRISGYLILEDNMPPRIYSRGLQVLSLLVIQKFSDSSHTALQAHIQ